MGKEARDSAKSYARGPKPAKQEVPEACNSCEAAEAAGEIYCRQDSTFLQNLVP